MQKSLAFKKILAVGLSISLLAGLGAGCGKKTEAEQSTAPSTTAVSTSTSTAPAPVTITVANYPKETDAAGRAQWDGWLKTMNEKYPNVTVKFDEYQYDVNSFFPKAASGQLTTVYQSWFTEINKIVGAGYSADITDAIKSYGYDKAINPGMLKLVEKDGKYYALPASGYAMGMWYNVNLFKQAGLVDENGVPKFPKTYDELAVTAQTIKEKTGKAGFFFPTKNNQGGWQFSNIAWSFGTEFEKFEDGKWKAAFNSPEAVAALQYLKDLKWKYNALQDNILSDIGEMQKLLGTDQVGCAFGTPDWIQGPINDYKMSKDNQAMSTVPAGPKGKVALAGGVAYFIGNNSTPEQIDAAFKWLEVTGYTPKYSDADAKAFEDNQKINADKNNIAGVHGLRIWIDPERVKMEDAAYEKYRNVDINMWKEYMDNCSNNIRPEEPVNCQELYKALDGVIQAVLTDKNADPKALLDKAVESFQKDYLDKVKN